LSIEAGRPNEARTALAAAQLLAPTDASLWERSLDLAVSQGRPEDARRDGLRLVELLRKPGLHARAKAVLSRLLTVDPEDDDLHVEFARTAVDCGDAKEGVRHLTGRAKELISARSYADARELYGEILAIEPGHKEASVAIEMIDEQEFERRLERRRRMRQTAITAAIVALIGLFVCCDVLARIDYAATRSLISSERMIERNMHADALALYRQLRAEHPLAVTAWFDLPGVIEDLEQRIADAPNGASGR
jgi:tetratricopeptide (TPR) repeat protein